MESLATKQDVKSKAASLLCNLARPFSSFSCNVEFPEMLRVPPAPVPYLSKASLKKNKKKRVLAFFLYLLQDVSCLFILDK